MRVQAWQRLGDHVVLAVLFVFLAVEVFQGALRYYLTAIGMPFLIYTPKLLVVIAFITLILNIVWTLHIRRPLLLATMLFSVFLLVGLYYTNNAVQPMFGVYALLPVLFAILAEPACSRFRERLVPYAALLWLCAAAGVVYDCFSDVPWAGLAYQLGELEVEGSRAWTYQGVERIAGFSRASFEAANQLLFLALPWVILGRRKSLGVLVWVATGTLIVLTTTKKTVGVYLFLTLMLLLIDTTLVPRTIKRMVSTAAPVAVVLVGIILPLSTLIVDYRLNLDSYVSAFLFASFEDRLDWMWPQSIALISDHGSFLLGRGIGGIGAAQQYFEPQLYSPADNLYLYLYATFGVASLALIGGYTANICWLNVDRDRWSRLLWFLAIAVLMSGWAANCIEGPFTASILGLTLAFAARQRTQQTD